MTLMTLLPAIPAEDLADNSYVAITSWLGFNGYNNFAAEGNIASTFISAVDAQFKYKFRIRNYLLTDTVRIISKFAPSVNQRSYAITKTNANLTFTWYRTVGTSQVKAVQFANCLDGAEHECDIWYDGTIDTNNGLDRVRLFIDGTEVTTGKTLSVNLGTLGDIVASTAQVGIGQDVNGRGDLENAAFYKGDIRDISLRDWSNAYVFRGLNHTIPSAESGTYTQNAQPILNGSKIYNAQDAGQCTVNSLVDTGTHWYLYYLGANPNVNSDRDETCLAIKPKDNNILTGWTKYTSGGLPVVVYGVGGVGKFDEKQVWLRCVRKKTDGTYEAWPMGESATSTFAIGYSTSLDGITWTRGNSGSPVYVDGDGGTVTYDIVRITDGTYYMVYAGQLLGANQSRAIAVATSPDGRTWTKIRSNILLGDCLGWPTMLKYIGTTFYIWFIRKFVYPSKTGTEWVLYTTDDFTNFTYHGVQDEAEGANELGMNSMTVMLQKPNGRYAVLRTSYLNRINKLDNNGEEFTCIKALELNRSDLPVAGRPHKVRYPQWVKRHWPLSQEFNSGTTFLERVGNDSVTINSTPVFSKISTWGNRTLGYVNLSGSQTITSAPVTFNRSILGVKMRVEIKTTGTHELFRIGNDIILSLESGKLRVRLSSNGSGYEKDYVSIDNISKPVDMPFVDDFLYVGFTFINGVLTLYNDFVPFPSVTKTNDTSLSAVNMSGSNVLIGQNATLKLRSVSMLTGMTNQNFIDLEV